MANCKSIRFLSFPLLSNKTNMKVFLLSGIILFLVIPCWSQQDSQKSPAEDVIDEMAKAYVNSEVQDLAIQKLEQMASVALDKNLTGKVGAAISLYGIYENIHSYNDAASDSQRYQASSHAIAHAAAIVNPLAGAVLQVSALFQDLSAAYIFKKYQIKFASMEADILNIQNQMSGLLKNQFEAENKALRYLLSRQSAIATLIKLQHDYFAQKCAGVEPGTGSGIDECQGSASLALGLYRRQVSTLKAIVQFEGRFLRFSNLVADPKTRPLFQDVPGQLDVLTRMIADAEEALTEHNRQMVEERIGQMDRELDRKRIQLRCEGRILKIRADNVFLKKSLKAKADEAYWIGPVLEENDIELQTLVTASCRPFLEQE